MGLKDRAASRTGGATTVISATKVARTPKGPVAPSPSEQRDFLVNNRISGTSLEPWESDDAVSKPHDYGRGSFALPEEGLKHIDNLASMASTVLDRGVRFGTYSENEKTAAGGESSGSAKADDLHSEIRAHIQKAHDLLQNASQGHNIGDYLTSTGDVHEAAGHIATAVNKLNDMGKSWSAYKGGPIDLRNIHNNLATSVNAYKKIVRSAPNKDPRIDPDNETDYSSASFGPSTREAVPEEFAKLYRSEPKKEPTEDEPTPAWNDTSDEENRANRGWRYVKFGTPTSPHPFADPLGESQRRWRDTARRLNPDIDKSVAPGEVPDYRGYVEENHPDEYRTTIKNINRGMGISQGMYSKPTAGEAPDDDPYYSNKVEVSPESDEPKKPRAKRAAKSDAKNANDVGASIAAAKAADATPTTSFNLHFSHGSGEGK